MKSIVIFGGAGFVGRYIITNLAKKDYRIIIPYQKPTNEAKLRLLGNFGQVIPLYYRDLKDHKLIKILNNSQICINLKTHWSSNKIGFDQSILDFNLKLSNLVKNSKSITQFIFFSGLGVDEPQKSLRSKAIFEAEKLFHLNLVNSIIIRPGIIIGKEDNFLSRLIPIFKISKIIPIFGNGKSRIQPISIEDVVLLVEKIIANNLKGKHIFELAGSKIFDYIELYKLIANALNKKRVFIKIPMILCKILVKVIERTPFSPISLEQLYLFEKDNIEKNIDKNLKFYSIYPQDIENIIKKLAKN